jgi:hypothetical protein
LPKDLFSEKKMFTTQIAALKKFANQDETSNVSLKLSQNHWKDLMEIDDNLEISPFTSNLNVVDFIQGKEMNIFHQINASWIQSFNK